MIVIILQFSQKFFKRFLELFDYIILTFEYLKIYNYILNFF